MRKLSSIPVKESVPELKQLQKRYPGKFKALQMLIHLKKQGPLSVLTLASLTGASDNSIHKWRSGYAKEGIGFLLKENRGGRKPAAITGKIQSSLSSRLNNPQQGFRSFVEIQQWLLTDWGVDMQYHAVNKYVKRNFGARLKVSRKSHIHKSPADEAVFKKPV
jgi:transposase